MNGILRSQVVVSSVFTACTAAAAFSCSDTSRCASVCARPFEMEESYARQRVQLLRSAPEPWPERAKTEFNRWLEAHNRARDSYLETCIAACQPARVVCQERAVNVAEWSACGR